MTGEPLTPSERARREAWLQELGEAAVLPPDDPQRILVEAEVSRRGAWAEAHWRALLEETDAWREALQDVDPPEDLARRLRAIPDQNAPVADRPGRRWAPWVLSSAAVVLLAIVVVLLPSRGDRLEDEIQKVALLALNDHLDTHDQDVLAEDPRRLEQGLQDHIPFPVRLPDLGNGISPVGGRRCTLGSHTVAFTAWRAPGGRVSLLQLRRQDFGLPRDMPPRVVHPQGAAARAHPLDILFFGRGDFVWVVVADAPADLMSVRRVVENS